MKVSSKFKIQNSKFWNITIIGLSLLLFLQIIAPFLKEGLFLGHDSQLHLTYLKKFEEAFFAGQFPVRWINWHFPGFNQPLFNFYQPGVYYLYLIPRFLGVPPLTALNSTLVFLWLLSAFLMFLFTKRHFGTLAGILAGYFYMIAPYHILNIFVRSALPEFAAMSFVPGVFWAIKSYFDSKKGIYLALVSLFLALVALSHSPTLVMVFPLILGYLGYLSHLTNLKTGIRVLFALFLGFGAASFFILPALFEQKFINIIFMRSGYYDFHHHFVCLKQLFIPFWGYGTSQTGCIDGISLQLGLAHWIGILLLGTILLVKFAGKYYQHFLSNFLDFSLLKTKDSIFFGAGLLILFISLYITLEISQPVWDTIPYFPFIQYPWRFLSPAVFLASFLTPAILILVKKDSYKLGLFVFFMLAATFFYGGYLHPAAYAKPEQVNFGGEILVDSASGIKVLDPEPGYMPKWAQVMPAEGDRPKEEVKFLDPQNLKQATQSAQIDQFKLAAHKKDYQINVSQPVIARFYTHYFPGWKVLVNNQKVESAYDNIYGFMDVRLEPGQNKIVLEFQDTGIRSFANNLSISSIIIALVLIFIV